MSSAAVQPVLALLSDAAGGDPTQYMVEKAFEHHQLDWRYLTCEVSPENLADAVRGIRALGFRGAHVGNPHKQAVLALLDRTSEVAGMVGAVSLILRQEGDLVGENTEGKGLLASLRRVADPGRARVVLLGAGRAARAVAVELAAAGVAELTIVNRTLQRAAELADLLNERFETSATATPWEGEYEVPEGTEVLIHATTLEREDADARLPLALEGLADGMIVADLTPNPPQTWLLREAEGRDCTTLDGLEMYIEQVAEGLRLWTGVDPDRDAMREAIEEFLEL